jgi:hypothetical protein
VNDEVNPLHGTRRGIGIANVAHDHIDVPVRRQQVAAATCEVVEHADLVRVVELPQQIRADEPGSAGDEYQAHRADSSDPR